MHGAYSVKYFSVLVTEVDQPMKSVGHREYRCLYFAVLRLERHKTQIFSQKNTKKKALG